GDITVNLGPLGGVSERGPIVFSASSDSDTAPVFKSQIEDLVKYPRGLVFQWANYDITAEGGRNFAFTAQDVFDRTAGITIDFGAGRLKSYRVATNSEFDGYGRPIGITLGYALQDILGLRTNDLVRDGGDGRCATVAVGDDVQVVPAGGVAAPKEVCVT